MISSGSNSRMIIIMAMVILSQLLLMINDPNVDGISRDPVFEIEICGNSNLLEEAVNNGWPGNGTPGNPVKIRNLSLELNRSKGESGLSLYSTDIHVIIENITVLNGYSGLDILYTKNLIIRNIFLTDCFTGIKIDESENISISDVSILNCGNGTAVLESKDVQIQRTYIRNSDIGIEIDQDSEEISINGCEIWNTSIGISLANSNDIDIVSLKIGEFRDKGINVDHVTGIKMDNSTIEMGLSYGIYTVRSSDLVARNCLFRDIAGHPIFTNFDANYLDLFNCTFSNNFAPLRIFSSHGTVSIRECIFNGKQRLFDLNHDGYAVIADSKFISDGTEGLRITKCNDLDLLNNEFIGSGIDILWYYDVSGFNIKGNKVNGKDLLFHYFEDLNSTEFSEGDFGQLILYGIRNVTIHNLSLDQAYHSIHIQDCDGIKIENNSFTSGTVPVNVYSSKNVTVNDCHFQDLSYGINFFDGDRLECKNNHFQDIHGEFYYILNENEFWHSEGSCISISHVEGIVASNNTLLDSEISIFYNGIQRGGIFENVIRSGKIGIRDGGSWSSEAFIRNNTIIDCPDGGILPMGGGYRIWENHMINCSFGFGYFNRDDACDIGLSENNTVNGIPIRYQYKGTMIETGHERRGQYIAMDCERVTISNISIEGASHGISIAFSDKVTLRNCVINNMSKNGIEICEGGTLDIFNNSLLYDDCGIYLNSDYQMMMEIDIRENTFFRDGIGMDFHVDKTNSERSIVTRNLLYECSKSIDIYRLRNTPITRNDIIGSLNISIHTWDPPGVNRIGPIIENNFLYNGETRIIYKNGTYHGISPNHLLTNSHDDLGIYGNYWSDAGQMDRDRDGVLDHTHRIGEFDDGKPFYDKLPIISPLSSRHLLLDVNETLESVNISWQYPDYDFLGNLTSLILHRMTEEGDDRVIGEMIGEPGFYNDPNIGDNKNYTYYLVPTFEKGEGYPSNSRAAYHDNTAPVLEITSPREGSLFRDVEEVLVEWNVDNEIITFLYFRVVVNGGDRIDVGSDLSFHPEDLHYGPNTIEVEVADPMGMTDRDEVTFFMDWKGPVIEVISPVDGTVYGGSTIHIFWNIWDEFCEVSEVTLSFNYGEWIPVTNLKSYTFYGLNEGTYYVRIEAIDALGNVGSLTRFINLVNPEMILSIEEPYEGQKFNTVNITLKWAIENFDMIDSIFISIDDGIWEQIGPTLQKEINFTIDGRKNIKIKARNILGKEYYDEVNISIDTSAPYVLETYPHGEGVPSDTIIFIRFSEEMEKGLVSIIVGSTEGEIIWQNDMAIVNMPYIPYPNENVQVEVKGMDLYGNEMETYRFLFRITNIGTVKGRVVNEEGDPISDARITSYTGESTISNSNGYFHYDAGEGGNKVYVSKEGYLDSEWDITILAEEELDLGNLILKRSEEKQKHEEKKISPWIIIIIGIMILVMSLIAALLLISRKKEEDYVDWEE